MGASKKHRERGGAEAAEEAPGAAGTGGSGSAGRPREHRKHRHRGGERRGKRSRSRGERGGSGGGSGSSRRGGPEEPGRSGHGRGGSENERRAKRERKEEREEPAAPKSAAAESSLSVEETNKLRAKLGLKPLETSAVKKEAGTKEDPVAAEVINPLALRQREEIREKLAAAKEKRLLNQKLGKVKTLGEEEPWLDDAAAWIERSRALQREKELAEKRAKLLEEMDQEFGVSPLVEEEFQRRRRERYSARDLQGLTVEHDPASIPEGQTLVLTLKDRGYQVPYIAIYHRRMIRYAALRLYLVLRRDAPARIAMYRAVSRRIVPYRAVSCRIAPYRAVSRHITSYRAVSRRIALYRDISCRIVPYRDVSRRIASYRDISRRIASYRVVSRRIAPYRAVSRRIAPYRAVSRRIVIVSRHTVTHGARPAGGGAAAAAVTFRKTRRRVRKLRKKEKPLKADDLLALAPGDTQGDFGSRSRGRGRRVQEDEEGAGGDPENAASPPEGTPQAPLPSDDTRTENMDISSDEEAAAPGTPPALEEDEAEQELQQQLERGRRLRQLRELREGGGEKALERAGRPVSPPEPPDSEEEENVGWSSVNLAEERQHQDFSASSTTILDEEPIVNRGLAAALLLCQNKGLLETTVQKVARVKAPNKSLPSAVYCIEDKMAIDDKYSRREEFRGFTQDFKEKEGYRPDVKIEYVDETGRKLTPKEAFRQLSHRFHGKGSGKMKTERRMKKLDEEALLKKMSSSDTPLGTVALLQEKQRAQKTPYIVLSGSGKSMNANTITK
ncbi:PREDICTED: U4/U6.U5 tri-snRNP-associated protein 1 [Pseudopodoces humilis]|uniref:U4/U6.U5 tri-snRNP-associated protein 1 n=1 Tax=Pseudopodoces humilis TaxID=181119 RepID=UPI0006B7BEE8|nr:PREDICTED: U4/U6.U5 tri-snRNP-associated protein 1 [Pseudopodoces humilis]